MTGQIDWAEETFGGAELGDHRRTRRLVALGASFAQRPAGRVTEVVHEPAAREAAFRFVENDAVDPSAIARAVHDATGRRCSSDRVVIVPVDQATLIVVDQTSTKGFGRIADMRPGEQRARGGLQVMSAIAVGEDGVSHGVVGQAWWNRLAKSPPWDKDTRPVEQRESGLWTTVLKSVSATFARTAPHTTPWYQLDRGGDAVHVIQLAAEQKLLITIRAAYDRALVDRGRLHRRLRQVQVSGRYHVAVPARPGRPARRATMSVRFTQVTLHMTQLCTGKKVDVRIGVVDAREVSHTGGARPLRWTLLTTQSVGSFNEAMRVIAAYTKRWRIEDFHRSWKSGTCNIERSQLRSPAAFRRWATIGAAVAARAEQLKTLSRAEPNRDACDVLSRAEVDAAIILSRTKDHRVGDNLTLERAVFLIACVGGYIGKHARTPPGVLNISRGLQRVVVGAEAIVGLNERSG
jgi:hypothetical protein